MGVIARWLWPLSVANLVANVLIVVTGGAVRVTGSGLGCPTWPRCTDASYVAHGELGVHGAIEFGNRLLTFALAAVAIACWVAALAAWRTRGRSARPFVLATLVALSIPAQAVLGGVTVLTDLNPYVVALHLLVTMAIIGVCVALLVAQQEPTGRHAPTGARRLAWLVLANAWVVLWLGTVVTGSGPHSGDEDARRTGLDPQVMSHVHAAAVYLLLALTVGLLVVARRSDLPALGRATTTLLVVLVLQGVVGFTQYYLDLPEALVVLHLLGAALVSAAATAVVLAASQRPWAGGDRGQETSGSTATATKSSAR